MEPPPTKRSFRFPPCESWKSELATMSWQPARDFIGYGSNPPDPQWPNGARLALNFVMNYEEGSEASIPDGDEATDTNMTEAHGVNQPIKGRDLAAESMFEYGSRVGFW